jgi:hypothetical protein
LNSVLAAAMLGLWLAARRFDWAIWLAVAFGGAAVLSVRFPGPTNWALAALMIGGYLIYQQIKGRQKVVAPAAVQSQTAASSAPPAPPQSSAAASSAAVVQGTPLSTPSPKGPPPGVEFIPLDPLKGRKSDD